MTMIRPIGTPSRSRLSLFSVLFHVPCGAVEHRAGVANRERSWTQNLHGSGWSNMQALLTYSLFLPSLPFLSLPIFCHSSAFLARGEF